MTKLPTLAESVKGVPGLRLEVSGAVATLTLSRPERLNALTFEMYEGLRQGFEALRGDPGVRAVILTGDGRGFCSGGDVETIIGELVTMDKKRLTRFTQMTCDVIAAMRGAPQPIIAAVNGVVGGAGAVMALASDVRLAVPDARIGFVFVRVGLSGADMGAAFLLPRLVGFGRASELLLTGDFIQADEAHRIGIYNRVVEPKKLLAEARALADKFTSGPQLGLRATKEALEDEVGGTLEDALAYDVRVQTECMLHPDFREAYEAFKAKRPAKFA